MNGRLLMLVFATGLFVSVWSVKDKPLQKQTVAPRNDPETSRRAVDAATIRAVVHTPPAVAEPVAADAMTETPAVRDGLWNVANCPTSMPPEITAGKYRVVSNQGAVGILEVAAGDIWNCAEPSQSTRKDVYTVETSESRWYFIRLGDSESGPVAAPASEKSAAPQKTAGPASDKTQAGRRMNRKFDFTGYLDVEPVTAESAAPLTAPKMAVMTRQATNWMQVTVAGTSRWFQSRLELLRGKVAGAEVDADSTGAASSRLESSTASPARSAAEQIDL